MASDFRRPIYDAHISGGGSAVPSGHRCKNDDTVRHQSGTFRSSRPISMPLRVEVVTVIDSCLFPSLTSPAVSRLDADKFPCGGSKTGRLMVPSSQYWRRDVMPHFTFFREFLTPGTSLGAQKYTPARVRLDRRLALSSPPAPAAPEYPSCPPRTGVLHVKEMLMESHMLPAPSPWNQRPALGAQQRQNSPPSPRVPGSR